MVLLRGRFSLGPASDKRTLVAKKKPASGARPLAGLEFASLLRGGLGFLALVPVVLLLELLDAAGGVDVLHLAGEERVTGRADFDGDVLASAASHELVAAAARDRA